MSKAAPVSEADILERSIATSFSKLEPESARAFLRLKLDKRSQQSIRVLLRKNSTGRITAEERIDLEKYLHVGQMLDLLHARALLALPGNGKRG